MGSDKDQEPIPVIKEHWFPDQFPINHEENRWSSGPAITLCVLHEISPHGLREEAITVVGGLAVCRHHMNIVVDKQISAYYVESILNDARNGLI